jgi:acetyl-CoA carboxylase biotin carboxyl carrier protein
VNLSNEDVQDILSLLDSLPYGELTLETSRFTLALRRTADGGWAQQTQVLSRPVPADPAERVAIGGGPVPPSGPPASDEGAAGPWAAGTGGDMRDVVTPLLGTFYRAPQPGAPPFVDVGSRVDQDTVVAIIETMKLMNPVYAGTTGTVSEICLDDGQFAEQGAVLMRISG